MSNMKGFFGIGVQSISKPRNAGNLIRSAHAFGASFFFTIDPAVNMKEVRASDTSGAAEHMPFYTYNGADDMQLPRGCRLIGVELTDDAVELPSFRHPTQAAYVLGPEKASLSDDLVERCDFVVKIPMKFCVNVGVAGALVMYDRMISLGRFAERPVRAGGPVEPLKPHVHGGKFTRTEGG